MPAIHCRPCLLVVLALLILVLPGVTPTVTAQGTITVTTHTNLNLRARAADMGDVLATIPYATTLIPDAVNADRTWVRVTFEGQQGWLFFFYLTVAGGSLAELPVVDPDAAAMSAAPSAGGGEEAGASEPVGWQVPVFLALDGFSVPHAWQGWVPAEARAETFAEARYVVYVRNVLSRPGLCASGDHEAYLTFSDYAVRIVEAASGQTVARRTFSLDAAPLDLISPYGRFQEAWGWVTAVLGLEA